ncbi:MAG: hypothetical protein IKE43_10325 [Coriobacteriales bacterium]|nr:hypothetical protein [Coriobacteriales bacterium]
MNLTFKGFLRSYVRELTGRETDSLKILCASVAKKTPTAKEALMVFAAIQHKAHYLAKLAHNTWMETEYVEIADKIDAFKDVETFLQSHDAPERYRKVWNSFIAKRDAIQADRRIIAIMRDKTLEALDTLNITIYQICQELGLNKGNVYAYINSGDTSKVSRDTARRILQYVQSS